MSRSVALTSHSSSWQLIIDFVLIFFGPFYRLDGGRWSRRFVSQFQTGQSDVTWQCDPAHDAQLGSGTVAVTFLLAGHEQYVDHSLHLKRLTISSKFSDQPSHNDWTLTKLFKLLTGIASGSMMTGMTGAGSSSSSSSQAVTNSMGSPFDNIMSGGSSNDWNAMSGIGSSVQDPLSNLMDSVNSLDPLNSIGKSLNDQVRFQLISRSVQTNASRSTLSELSHWQMNSLVNSASSNSGILNNSVANAPTLQSVGGNNQNLQVKTAYLPQSSKRKRLTKKCCFPCGTSRRYLGHLTHPTHLTHRTHLAEWSTWVSSSCRSSSTASPTTSGATTPSPSWTYLRI